jgi:DNA-binding MarR family transcriptional regulator
MSRIVRIVRSNHPKGEPPELDALADAVVRELGGALRELRCGLTERIIRQGASMTQIHVLWLLEHHGELPMSRLAELLGVSASNGTGLVERMEERGLVERRRVPDDRRVVVVGIGPEGLRLLRGLQDVHQDRIRQALQRLDHERLEKVLDAFADFRAAVEAELGTSHRHAIDPEPITPADPTPAPVSTAT